MTEQHLKPNTKFTTEQYIKLKDAYAMGVTSVNYGDKTVTYRSLSDMKQILEEIKGEIYPEQIPRNRYFTTFNRGFNKCEY